MYLKSTGNISPQRTFGNNFPPGEAQEYTGNWLSCIEPDYREFIDVKSIRRMSRIIKMGVAAGMSCLKEAGISSPDAIITGTAYGCLQDTEVFLTKMVENNEELLTPTAFIQSTHNTVGAQIALMVGCHGYNNTFVHRGFSFETALLDAKLQLEETEINNVLVGGLDEITESSHAILNRMGIYRQGPVSNLDLFSVPSKGTIAGEGAAFFLVTARPSGNDYARLEAVQTFYKPIDEDEIRRTILDFLSSSSYGINDIDLLIEGRNGDFRGDGLYDRLARTLFQSTQSIPYKHLCGEYPTSSAFALWLACVILKSGQPFVSGKQEKAGAKPVKRILIYNEVQNIHHSLFLVTAC
jgi:3-oxoacyl-[acyl-carrier-protein] synthase II